MPPKRNASRAAQLQPQPILSDYDTDTAKLTDTQYTMADPPAPPPRSIEELNLTVLQRWYPNVTQIISTAPYAVLYTHDQTLGQWEKCETEGTLFVCQLEGERYRINILNRKGIENFTLDLTSPETLDLEGGYIIAQLPDGEICGLWIFNDSKAGQRTDERIWEVVKECAVRAEELAGQAGEGNAQSHAQNPHGMDGAEETEDAETDTYEEPVAPSQSNGFTRGQSIDLATLFSKSRAAPEYLETSLPQPVSQHSASLSTERAPQGGPPRFTSTADTDFSRTLQSPLPPPIPQAAPAPQQNTLLDLFRNAKRA